MVGVDIGGTKVRVLVANELGDLVSEARELTSVDVIDQVVRLVRDHAGSDCGALGVGVPGTVDPRTGRISRIPNVAMLEDCALQNVLESELGIPVCVENDLIAAALAESAVAPSVNTLAVLGAGTGIGLGIVVRGTALRGFRGGAGEIADLPMDGGLVLEDIVSVSGLVGTYQALAGAQGGVESILSLAERGDAAALSAVEQYAVGLAHAVKVVLAVLDPDRIVLTGGLGVARVVRAALAAELPPSIPVPVLSSFGVDLPAHGALSLARRASDCAANVG